LNHDDEVTRDVPKHKTNHNLSHLPNYC
jgi:hypothetical protein